MKQSPITDGGARLRFFTPLRYPGGKGKLAAFVKSLIEVNQLGDGEYAEPYAGGAAVALELLFHEYVRRIHINDKSKPVHDFWSSVLNSTDELCRLIRDTPLSVSSWDKQKKVFSDQENQDSLALGFATFFLNRTNRSGILNGGIIGGRAQTGEWKIDARYNTAELINRVQMIAAQRDRIELTQLDALAFLERGIAVWPKKTLIYLDPPYFEKGRHLYYDFYSPKDHDAVAEFVTQKIKRQSWIVSYDNVSQIRKLYSTCRRMTYSIGYSARDVRSGAEVMFFAKNLEVPEPTKTMSQVRMRKASELQNKSA